MPFFFNIVLPALVLTATTTLVGPTIQVSKEASWRRSCCGDEEEELVAEGSGRWPLEIISTEVLLRLGSNERRCNWLATARAGAATTTSDRLATTEVAYGEEQQLLLMIDRCWWQRRIWFRRARVTVAGAIRPSSSISSSTLSEKVMEGEKQEAIEKEVAKVPDVSLKELSRKLEEFALERDWMQFHSPRNLLLAVVGEVGELAEIFMWRGEVAKGLPNWEESDKEHLGEELSDVLLYLIRLSDICGVDLGEAALKKIVKNAIKYPAKAT
ncbi:hypothetical protein B296_00013379 [Ensete ventricosum]|nr:hypothetical protein B296_00013379 [Ensete ventricosum]